MGRLVPEPRRRMFDRVSERIGHPRVIIDLEPKVPVSEDARLTFKEMRGVGAGQRRLQKGDSLRNPHPMDFPGMGMFLTDLAIQ